MQKVPPDPNANLVLPNSPLPWPSSSRFLTHMSLSTWVPAEGLSQTLERLQGQACHVLKACVVWASQSWPAVLRKPTRLAWWCHLGL